MSAAPPSPHLRPALARAPSAVIRRRSGDARRRSFCSDARYGWAAGLGARGGGLGLDLGLSSHLELDLDLGLSLDLDLDLDLHLGLSLDLESDLDLELDLDLDLGLSLDLELDLDLAWTSGTGPGPVSYFSCPSIMLWQSSFLCPHAVAYSLLFLLQYLLFVDSVSPSVLLGNSLHNISMLLLRFPYLPFVHPQLLLPYFVIPVAPLC